MSMDTKYTIELNNYTWQSINNAISSELRQLEKWYQISGIPLTEGMECYKESLLHAAKVIKETLFYS